MRPLQWGKPSFGGDRVHNVRHIGSLDDHVYVLACLITTYHSTIGLTAAVHAMLSSTQLNQLNVLLIECRLAAANQLRQQRRAAGSSFDHRDTAGANSICLGAQCNSMRTYFDMAFAL